MAQLTEAERDLRRKAVFDRVVTRNGGALRKLAAAEREEHRARLQRNLAHIKRVNGEGLRELAQY